MNSCSEMWRKESETSALTLYLSLCPSDLCPPFLPLGNLKIVPSVHSFFSSQQHSKNHTVNTSLCTLIFNTQNKQHTSTANNTLHISGNNNNDLAAHLPYALKNKPLYAKKYIIFSISIIYIWSKILLIFKCIYMNSISFSFLCLGICM